MRGFAKIPNNKRYKFIPHTKKKFQHTLSAFSAKIFRLNKQFTFFHLVAHTKKTTTTTKHKRPKGHLIGYRSFVIVVFYEAIFCQCNTNELQGCNYNPNNNIIVYSIVSQTILNNFDHTQPTEKSKNLTLLVQL